MQSLNGKITGSTVTAFEWNQMPTELQNVITALGITLSSGDLDQLGKGIAGYVASSNHYAATGTANALVLTTTNSLQALPILNDGTEARFRAILNSTGAATVNVDGLGVKSLVNADGSALAGGELESGRTYTIEYNLSGNVFVITVAPVSAQVNTVVGGTNITVDAADPANPIVNLDAVITGLSVNGVTLTAVGLATDFLNAQGNYVATGGQVNAVQGGTNVSVDATDPANPIVNLDAVVTGLTINGVVLSSAGSATNFLNEQGSYSAPAGGGQVNAVVGGINVTVDALDPANPIINLDAVVTGLTVNGVTLITAGSALSFLNATGVYSVPAGGGGGGTVDNVLGGTNISVNATDPANPIVNLDAVVTGLSVNGVTLTAAGATTNFLNQAGGYSVPAGADAGQVDSVVGGTNVSVNAIDPANPIVSLDSVVTGLSVNGVTLTAAGLATTFLNAAGVYSVPAGGGGGGQVNAVLGGTNVSVNATDPANPIVNLDAIITGLSVNGVTLTTSGSAASFLNEAGAYSVPAGGGQVNAVLGGTNVSVNATDPANPIVNLDALVTGLSVNGVTLSAAGAGTSFLNEAGAYSVPDGTGGQVDSVVSGSNITIDAADPANPIANLDAAVSITSMIATGSGAGSNSSIRSVSAIPTIELRNTTADLDEKSWSFGVSSSQLQGRLTTDNDASSVNWLQVTRTGTTVDLISLLGTTVAMGGAAIANSFNGVVLTTAGASTNFLNEQGNYVVPAGGGGGGQVDSVVGGNNIEVNISDPINPIVNLITNVNTASLTGTNTDQGSGSAIASVSSSPAIGLSNTGQSLDNKNWDIKALGTSLVFRAVDDANSLAGTFMSVGRVGTVINLVTFPGTAAVFSGTLTAASFNGVAITNGGATTNFLNEGGAYSVPEQGAVGNPNELQFNDGGVLGATSGITFLSDNKIHFDDGKSIIFGTVESLVLTYNGVNASISNLNGGLSINNNGGLAGGDFTIRNGSVGEDLILQLASTSGNESFRVTDSSLVNQLEVTSAGATIITGTLNVTGTVDASAFNLVPLTTTGVATNFLDETGNYSVPAGGGGGGAVDSVNSGVNITVNNADPANPIVNLNSTVTTASFQGTGTGSGSSSTLRAVSSSPAFGFFNTSVGSDNRNWDIKSIGAELHFRVVDDANALVSSFMEVQRTGINIDRVAFPNGPVVITETVTAASFNGVALSAAGVATNFLNETGNYSVPAGGGGGTPGGSDSQVQYNSGGAFAGNANFRFDETTGHVGIGTAPSSSFQLFILAPDTENGIVSKVINDPQFVWEGQNNTVATSRIQGGGNAWFGGSLGVGTSNAGSDLLQGLEVSDFFGGLGGTIRLSNSGAVLVGNEFIGEIGFHKSDAGGPGAGVTGGMAMFGALVEDQGTYMVFSTSDATTLDIERMRIDETGKVSMQDALTVESYFQAGSLTTGERDALTPVNGMIIYNETTQAFNFREDGFWVTGTGLK